jgi:hypothetical protein
MKNIFKYFSTAASILAIGSLALTSCEETDYVSPDTRFTPFNFSAQFKFVNASPDAPTMDFFVQGIGAGNDLTFGNAQTGYTRIPLASNLTSFGQVSLRGTASSGNIGGTLGSAAAIFRAGSTNNNAFAPINRGRYTVFAVDTINRPRPERTLNQRIVAGETVIFADTTYSSTLELFRTKSLINPVQDTAIELTGNNETQLFNLVRRYNNNVRPSFMPTIGIVPLGSSDVGGVRYYVWQDSLRTFALGNLTQSAIRFVNLAAGNTRVFVRLRPVGGGTNINLPNSTPTASAYALSKAGGFDPSVGSRIVTTNAVNFNLQTTVAGGVEIEYVVEIWSSSDFSTPSNLIKTIGDEPSEPIFKFSANKNYTVYLAGVLGKPSLTARFIQHD